MSKEHFCKAKRVNWKELSKKEWWVEGYYFCMVHNDDRHGHHFIMPLGVDLSLGMPIEKIQVEIEPETVCECIGIPDKFDKMIFEGDIVKRKIFDNFIIGEVVWLDVGFCGFYLKCGKRYYPMGRSEHIGKSDCDESIGNIFDNPEKLKSR